MTELIAAVAGIWLAFRITWAVTGWLVRSVSL